MRRRKTVVISILLLFCTCLFLSGCFREDRVSYALVGKKVFVSEEESIKVLSTEATDGKIVVKLELDLQEMKLSDFQITVHKNETGSPMIDCDISESRALNESEIFDAPYKGKIYLVFTDDSISSRSDVTRYSLFLDYFQDNGIVVTYRFCLGNKYS